MSNYYSHIQAKWKVGITSAFFVCSSVVHVHMVHVGELLTLLQYRFFLCQQFKFSRSRWMIHIVVERRSEACFLLQSYM